MRCLLLRCALLLAAVLPAAQDPAPSRSVPESDREARAPRVLEELELGAEDGSLAPRFGRSPAGNRWLVWVEPAGERWHQRLARLGEQGLEEVLAVEARGEWFTNWADVAAVCETAGGTLLASRLLAGRTEHAYDARLAARPAGGASFTPPRPLHRGGGEDSHEFVTLVPLAEGGAFAVWLDGCEAAREGPGGPMTLRAALIGEDGKPGESFELDGRTCDCCPTDAAETNEGRVVVVYRDRSVDEVRDIAWVVGDPRRPQSFSAPRRIARDGWRIAGCPVNGPAVEARGGQVAVAWFTLGGDGTPRVRCARSRDGGETFGEPIDVAVEDVEGRVDLVLAADGSCWILWLARVGRQGRWRVARIDPGGKLSPPIDLATTSLQRTSGIARLAAAPEGLWFAWTDVGPPTRVRALRLSLSGRSQRAGDEGAGWRGGGGPAGGRLYIQLNAAF